MSRGIEPIAPRPLLEDFPPAPLALVHQAAIYIRPQCQHHCYAPDEGAVR